MRPPNESRNQGMNSATAFSPAVLTASAAIRSLRPAPVAALVASLCGLNRRQPLPTAHGVFFISPVSDLGAHLLSEGEYEPQMRAVLEKFLSPGHLFIDAGANEGYFSVVASRLVGPRGMVIAIEPQTRLQRVIQANFDLNGCENVKIIQAFISGQDGDTNIELAPETNSGATSAYPQWKYKMPRESVRSCTLASFLAAAEIAHCDLMKVDVEGAEYEIFMNAGDVLRAGTISNIAIEIHNSILYRRGLSGNDLHKLFLQCGYVLDNSLGVWVYRWRAGHI